MKTTIVLVSLALLFGGSKTSGAYAQSNFPDSLHSRYGVSVSVPSGYSGIEINEPWTLSEGMKNHGYPMDQFGYGVFDEKHSFAVLFDDIPAYNAKRIARNTSYPEANIKRDAAVYLGREMTYSKDADYNASILYVNDRHELRRSGADEIVMFEVPAGRSDFKNVIDGSTGRLHEIYQTECPYLYRVCLIRKGNEPISILVMSKEQLRHKVLLKKVSRIVHY